MNYQLLTNPNDALISTILSVYKLPSIAQFISIDETNYWNYVTSTKNVWFYKVYKDNFLVSTIHLEICDRILFTDIIVFPEYQKKGIATEILKDIKNGKLGIDFDKIQVSIDEKNIASIKLFENAGFLCVAKDEELLDYMFINN